MYRKNSFSQKKSLITNLLAAILTITGFYLENNFIFIIGLFSLSGAITNWLAVHMLFEKVPLLYGSGVIPNKFEEFKSGIKNLIHSEFFNKDNIEKITDSKSGNNILSDLSNKIDFEKLYEGLVEAISNSKLGGLLSMFGGKEALTPAKDEIISNLKILVSEMINDVTQNTNMTNEATESFLTKAEKVIDNRLDELTPIMVKEIIQNMIRNHLGWLVVWGGVFGGLIGAISTLIL